MTYSRRDLGRLLPALAAANAAGESNTLPSKALKHEDLAVKNNGKNSSRAILKGETHTGFPIEIHETELAPGEAPHPPHHHVREEMVMIRDGMLDVTISGKTERLGPGSVVYVASGEEHGWKNPGTERARYFVMALGPDK